MDRQNKPRLAQNGTGISEAEVASVHAVELALFDTNRDPLTHLHNHAEFQRKLLEQFTRVQQRQSHLACMLLNIDYFNSINRRFGYDFGDAVLQQIGEILQQCTPASATLARFSGEEFAVLLPTRTESGALEVAEELRKTIADHHFAHNKKSTYLTVSTGLSVSDQKTRSASHLLATARLVLRTAKREGRNRVCYWKKDAPCQTSPVFEDVFADLQQKFADLEREMKAFSNAEVRSMLNDFVIPDGLSDDHAENVAFIAATIADELSLPEADIDTIISAALLHDIGKLGIDKGILSKEDELTQEEFEEIKKHPLLGVEFLNEARFFEQELPLILHHHERFDGKGYPDGLAGEDIPLGARIIGLAETIDGLLSGTTYRESHSIQETILELQRCAGTQFDPHLVKVATKLLEVGRLG